MNLAPRCPIKIILMAYENHVPVTPTRAVRAETHGMPESVPIFMCSCMFLTQKESLLAVYFVTQCT